MKKAVLKALLISVFIFYGCGEKNSDNIYDKYEDSDSDTDNNSNSGSNDNNGNSDNSEEGGCAPSDDKEKNDYDTKPDDSFNDFDPVFDDDSIVDDDIEEKDDQIEEKNDPDAESPDEIFPKCPIDMVENGSSCIDKYEASKKDATGTSQGADESIAISKGRVLPWMVNPMNEESYNKFKKACAAAGKRLCRDDEWIFACEGAEKTLYSWGNQYERELCNSLDTFCDEYCIEKGINEGNCNLSENCGYEYYCFRVVKTGDFYNCKNHSGAFDINGNVWEITDTGDDYKVRGGAFNCAYPVSRLKCGYAAGWEELYAGFRCCKDR